MLDMFNVLGKVKDAQAKMKTTQENLLHLVLSAESGAGMVKATMNGHKQLIKLEIDPSLASDLEMLQDLTIAAVNLVANNIDELVKEEMKKSMEGVLPNIPGMDLSAFMK